MRQIVFVGDEPSAKNVDPDIPFVGTQSYKTLLNWIWQMDIDISNVSLCNRDKILVHPSALCVALGQKASKTLVELRVPHFVLPHPSPKNRVLNKKHVVEAYLRKCKEYLRAN